MRKPNKTSDSVEGLSPRKQHRLKQLEEMLSPRFKPHIRSRTQETIAGVVLGLIILAFIVSVLLWGYSSNRVLLTDKGQATPQISTVPQAAAPPSAQQQFLQTSVQSWHFSSGGEFFKPGSGDHFVDVEVTIKQLEPNSLWLAPSLQSYVVDQSGQRYALAPDDSVTDPLEARSYAPGEVAKGTLSYETPVKVGKLSWCYDLSSDAAHPNPLCISLQ